MMDREKYRPWRKTRPADNQDIYATDPMPEMAAGTAPKRPGNSASEIARAGYETIERVGSGSPRPIPLNDY